MELPRSRPSTPTKDDALAELVQDLPRKFAEVKSLFGSKDLARADDNLLRNLQKVLFD